MKTEPLEGTWLLSFADLLTLVLCTFLMLFSMTWGQRKENALSNSKDGIQIAHNGSDVEVSTGDISHLKTEQRLEYGLLQGDFDQGILTENGRNRVRNWLESIGYTGEPVRVLLCNRVGFEVSDVVPLARQLFDVGIARKTFRIDFGGGTCEGNFAVTMKLYG